LHSIDVGGSLLIASKISLIDNFVFEIHILTLCYKKYFPKNLKQTLLR